MRPSYDTTDAALAEAKVMRAKAAAEFEAKVRKHHAEGMTPTEIGRRLGTNNDRVTATLRRLGLKPGAKGGRAEAWRDL